MILRVTARLTLYTSLGARTMIILGLLGLCFLGACSNPLSPSRTLPQPGKVLYTVHARFDKPVHSTNDMLTVPVTLIAEAVQSENGQNIWRTSLRTGLTVLSSPDSIIIPDGSTIFVVLWVFQQPRPQQKPVKGQVLALDAQSGQMLWKTTLDGSNIQQPVVAKGKLYIIVDDRVEALDGSSGRYLWRRTLPGANYHTTELRVTENALYVAQEANNLPVPEGHVYDSAIVRALRLNDGAESWQRKVEDTLKEEVSSLIHVDIEIDARTVYVLSAKSHLEIHGNVGKHFPFYTLSALNVHDGSLRWRNQTQRSEESGRSFDLVLFNQVLYLVGNANPGISALSAFQSQDGKQLWAWQTPRSLSVFVPPNHIYGSSLNKGEAFCALHERDGSKAWCTSYSQTSQVLFSQGKIYMYGGPSVYHDSSLREQPSQVCVFNESDGLLVAQYSLGDEVPRTVTMALS